jgi:hypothetical protein
VQPYNYTKLGAFNDRDLGALIVRDNGSIVTVSVDVVADPCPDVLWSFDGSRLGSSKLNETFAYNNACIRTGTRSSNWTFFLNVTLTEITSGYYSASFTNVAGTTVLPRTYITIPSTLIMFMVMTVIKDYYSTIEPVSAIGLSLNDTCLLEGSTVSLECEIRGFPRPRVDFRHNGIIATSAFENILLEFYNQARKSMVVYGPLKSPMTVYKAAIVNMHVIPE